MPNISPAEFARRCLLLSCSWASIAAPYVERITNTRDEAIKALQIKKLNWDKGGFDTVMLIDVTFKNTGKQDIKDIKLKCEHYSNSGTKIDSNKRIIYEIVRTGKTKTIREFSMGMIHSQATRSHCEVVDLIII